MRVLEFITGHMVYNLAYTSILQTTITMNATYLTPNIARNLVTVIVIHICMFFPTYTYAM